MSESTAREESRLAGWAQNTGRVLLVIGLATLACGAYAAFWEWLASQPPDSNVRTGILPGPIDRLAARATTLGVVTCMLSQMIQARIDQLSKTHAFVMLACAGGIALGCGLQVSALWQGASSGRYIVHLYDTRAPVHAAVLMRLLGEGLYVIFASWMFVSVLRAPLDRGSGSTH